jgi:ribosomal protein S18 acetylase RimI-like enzyme
MISFREALPGDAAAIGALHVTSWRETYGDILPHETLKNLSPEERSAMWSAVLSGAVTWNGIAVFLAETAGEIVGFGACGDQRDEALKDRGFDGEFGAIYVLRSHQQVGVGKALMSLMAERLLDQGRTAAALWVLSENVPARAFYERLDGVELGQREEEQSGATLAEVAYGWSDLPTLLANSSS